MGLIIFLQGCEKMKINEVKELLAGTPTCEQLAELKADERSGVQKLLAAYYKRLEKAAQEKERFTKMLSYEKKYYAQGIQYVAGVDEAGRGPLAGPLVIAAVILPQDVFDRQDAVQLLLDFMLQKYPEALASKYAVTVEEEETAQSVMAKIATARGCLKAGGMLDLDKVDQLVLRDFRSGRLGRFTVDEP